MEVFAEKRDIELKKTPPLHPQANPAETFMKSLGKTMKIAHENKTSKREALSTLLKNVRDTPQQATDHDVPRWISLYISKSISKH